MSANGRRRDYTRGEKEAVLRNLPDSAKEVLKKLRGVVQRKEPLAPLLKCPAAEERRFSDTDVPHCFCKIERQPLALPGAGLGLASFCCNDYAACPTWQAMKEKDPIIDRTYEAVERREVEDKTAKQIASGLRVDDREERFLEESLKNSRPHSQARDTEEDLDGSS